MESVRMVLMASWSSCSSLLLRSCMALTHRLDRLRPGRFFQMPPEFVTHGRQELVGEIGLAARAEPLVESRGEHMRRHALVDGGLDGPAAFAGIGYAAGEFRQARVLNQRGGRQVEQPRRNHAAA